MSTEYKSINKWFTGNVPAHVKYHKALTRASEYFRTVQGSMNQKEMAAWSQFLSLGSIVEKCDLEALHILRKNFDDAGLNWPENSGNLKLRLQKMIYKFQEEHSAKCTEASRALVGSITYKYNVHKRFLGKLINRLDRISEVGAFYYSRPNSSNEVAFYEGIEKMAPAELAGAIYQAFKFSDKNFVNSLNRETSKSMIEITFDTCNQFIITTHDWMDVLIFNQTAVELNVSMGQDDMDYIRFTWLRFHICEHLIKRSQSELIEAIKEQFKS